MERAKDGRKKLPMVKIENDNHLRSCFSKRRYDIFSKATDLTVMCGTKLVVIVFSPGKRVFAFGHPSADAVVDEFLAQNGEPNTYQRGKEIEGAPKSGLTELCSRLSHVEEKLARARYRGRALDARLMAFRGENWWGAPIEGMNLEQLEQLMVAMEELKIKVGDQTQEMQQAASPPFDVGGSSSSVDGVGYGAPPMDEGPSGVPPCDDDDSCFVGGGPPAFLGGENPRASRPGGIIQHPWLW
ncbi:agamous-like MADS-box protein AGL61 [Diospyros lotus]|uniref:agamous-like MADS-box protein AGL61 n=1 Tax=Diospyros lotus TaxID=55363 RepID=UPI002259482A|nr:agamous-like MADS-box protein AGL61 [Diospyros lotus]